ncbi:transcriptional regulator [Salmonella enterica subsp. enterica serovar Bredeney]
MSSIRKVDSVLAPGKVSDAHFSVLIELSSVRSEKIIYALHDCLVMGESRKTACERHGASISYFSISLGRLLHAHQLVLQLMPFYRESANTGVAGIQS